MNSNPPRLRPYRRLGLNEQIDRLEALRRDLAALLDEQYWTALRELVFDRPLREFLIEHHPGPPYEQ